MSTNPNLRNMYEQRARELDAAPYMERLQESQSEVQTLTEPKKMEKTICVVRELAEVRIMLRPRAFQNHSSRGRPNNLPLQKRFREAMLLLEEAFAEDEQTTESTVSIQADGKNDRFEKCGNAGNE